MKNKEIEELWKEHESAAFPASCRGVDVRGIERLSAENRLEHIETYPVPFDDDY